MSDFKTATPAQEPLDPYERVHYTFGLVLGRDDFVQEQTYFLEKHRLHNRALHGYGTVCGLGLGTQGSGAGFEVTVSAGLAVNPKGQTIRVPAAQCARLNAWLARHRDQLVARLGSPPSGGPLSLFVVLCHDECLTDQVPIPGGPCRSQEESMAPSRVADHFQLHLSWTPPSQVEEEAVRAFGELLRSIEVGGPGPFLTQEQVETLVRDLGADLASPPGSPPESSPPGEPWMLDPDEAADILRAAFRVWATEVRPTLLGGDVNCAGGPPREGCVLLGEVSFQVTDGADGNFVVDESTLEFDESRRPVLLHTRLLQEWMLCGRPALEATALRSFATLFAAGGNIVRAWLHHPDLLDVPSAGLRARLDDTLLGSPTVSRPDPAANVFDLDLGTPLAHGSRVDVVFSAALVRESAAPNRSLAELLAAADFGYLDRQGDLLQTHLIAQLPTLDVLADVDVSAAADGDVLGFDGGSGRWVPVAPAVGGVSDHGALTGLEDDDHPQYLLANGSRALGGNWSAGGNRITGLGAGVGANDAVRFQQAVKVGDPAGGDLSGAYPNPRVTGFVAAPAGPYAIVAAGFFQPDGTPIGPVYNGLRVRAVAPPGTYSMTFQDYLEPPPGGRFTYIVKGTPGDLPQGQSVRTTFQFIEFRPQIFRVRVLGTNNEPTNQPFMVEVSRLGVVQP